MKNKIRFLAVLASFLFALPLSAAEKKLSNPGKNEVIIIGRITVKAKEDMNFIATTRGLTEEEKATKSNYPLPYAPENPKILSSAEYEDLLDDNPKADFDEGEFFYAVYKVNQRTRNLKFIAASKYRFFGSEKTYIWVPLDFNVDVPKGVSAMYIGTFAFETGGKDFTFTKIKHIDEYDQAQEVLNKVTKKHFDLYRATIKNN